MIDFIVYGVAISTIIVEQIKIKNNELTQRNEILSELRNAFDK